MLGPVYSPSSHTLILGSMPSPKSREKVFYYANPQNRFWRAIAGALNEPVPTDDEERMRLIVSHGLALWDVLYSCKIIGASDSSIRDPVANDIPALLERTAVTRVFTTGQTAGRLYTRLVYPKTEIPCGVLPSPSPANAAVSLDTLIETYRKMLFDA